MRMRRLFLLSVLAGPAYLACQLVDPASDLDEIGDAGTSPSDGTVRDVTSEADVAAVPDATPFCLGVDATLCDGFDQDGPVDAAPAQDIFGTPCDTGSISVVAGQLSVDHPANDGSAYSRCVLQSEPTGTLRSFTLDFDFRYQLLGDPPDAETTPFSIVAAVTQNLSSANDAGIMSIDYQLLLNGQGDSQFIALPYYPPPSKLAFTQTHQLVALYPLKLPQATSCHLSLAADLVNVTGTATAVCGGQTLVYTTPSPDPPAGLSVPATLSLGYIQTGGKDPLSEWSIQYDNALFRASP